MTAHDLAKKLLASPDIPVVVWGQGHSTNHLFEEAAISIEHVKHESDFVPDANSDGVRGGDSVILIS